MLRILLLILCLSAAGAASAQSVQTAYAGGSPVVLTIPVTVSIENRCVFADGAAPAGSFNKDNFDRDGLATQFDFSLNCNGPSRVAISSANGGLLTAASAPSGYRNKADYQVTLNLMANNGTLAQASCSASTMQSGGTCAFSGKASTSVGFRLASAVFNQAGSYLKITALPQATSAAPLIEGSYADVLTVTLSPAI